MKARIALCLSTAALLGTPTAAASAEVLRGAASDVPVVKTSVALPDRSPVAPAPSIEPAPTPTTAAPTPTYADPLSSLGARSPSCATAPGPMALRNCRRTGSVAHRYPISAYGFDVQVGFSVTDLGDSFLGALQSIAALLWMALVYLVKGVLLLLEWAFSLDLLGTSMTDVRRTLERMHHSVLGEPWFLAAISVTALWGIWRGLVLGQTSQTIAGLASTTGLMVVGLVLLTNPAGTVGHASRLVNEASLGVLAATTGGPLDRPTQALSDTMGRLFDQMVRDPWCALQFGSVDYCDESARGERTMTNADVWLSYPAQSRERKGLYRLLKGEDPDGSGRPGIVDALAGPVGGAALDLVGIGDAEDSRLPGEVRARVAKSPERAAMQEAGGTVPRFALLALIAVGMTGAVGLLAYVGIRLLLASMFAMLLLLFAPAVLLAPAFGESGRATFVAWAKRLAGAVAAKLIYALFLAVVIAASATITRIGIGWFGIWLVQIAFWWGVLLKREELLGFATAGAPRHIDGGSRGSVLSGAYHGAQLAWMGRRVATGATRAVGTPLAAARSARAEHRSARTAAVASLATERLDAQAEQAFSARRAQASEVVGARRQLERELRVIDRQLSSFDEIHASARAEGTPVPTPGTDQAALLRRRSDLLEQLNQPEHQEAEQIVRRANQSVARTGTPVDQQDLRAYRESRRRAHAANLPIDDERHLRAAGIDPSDYRSAPGIERSRMREAVALHLDQERRLLATTEGRREVTFDPALVRQRTAQERAERRAEHRARTLPPSRPR